MDLCPDALYLHLASDLSHVLPTVPWNILSDPNGVLEPWPGCTGDQRAAIALKMSLFKKLCLGTSTSAVADARALKLFEAMNNRCREWTIDWNTISEFDAHLLGEFESCLHDALAPMSAGPDMLDIHKVLKHLDVGPGSSVSASGDSFYHKIAVGPMSSTDKSLYEMYKWYVKHFTLESDVEKTRSAQFGECLLTQGSTLSFAKKNSRISRVICTEPLLNMMYQKGLSTCFEECLRIKFGINLSRQPLKNKELARIGSINGQFGTIDCTSASDLNSIGMLRNFMPPKIFRYLMKFRSPMTKLPQSGEWYPLSMISSMGNGFTFSLMTLIFCCVVQASYRLHDVPMRRPGRKSLGNFGVFGDDLVVVNTTYKSCIRLLELLGHLPNTEKSFNDGTKFRESCGGDYYNGRDIRGIYAKDFTKPQHVYALHNRLQHWACNQNIPLCSTLNYLRELAWFLPIPPWENLDAGYMVRRQDAEFMSYWGSTRGEPDMVTRDANGSVIYQAYQAVPSSVDLRAVGERPFILKKGGGKKIETPHNHGGILLAAVCGKLRDGALGLRIETNRYIRRLRTAPCWDWHDPAHSLFTDEGWRRWVTDGERLTGVVFYESLEVPRPLRR